MKGDKTMKKEIMSIHTELVKGGNYEAARLLLRFMRRKIIRLGCSDSEWQVESLLEDIGFHPEYSTSYYTATFKMI